MAKPITGQYECEHRSSLGIGLDYYTSRLDRLTLLANGRFTLVVQDKSRMSHAAKALLQGQQPSMAAPETRREGTYVEQGNQVRLNFDDGGLEQGQVSRNGDGIQLGPNFFTKVSDSTMLPPTHRVQKNMEDIAKGLKIAGAIGGIAMKAAKEIQGAMQPTQSQSNPPAAGQAPAPQPRQASTPTPAPAPTYRPPQQAYQAPPQANSSEPEPLYCDQCGTRARPGKRFCGHCGAELP